MKDLKLGQLNVQFAPDTLKHVKKSLPPSLSGFPGEADIRYYVKATVVRPKFFQENIRTVWSHWIDRLILQADVWRRQRISSSYPSNLHDHPSVKRRHLPDAKDNSRNTPLNLRRRTCSAGSHRRHCPPRTSRLLSRSMLASPVPPSSRVTNHYL